MSSINTNNSAMNALSTLRSVNQGLNETQNRISTGLKVSSGKDNAAYFAISETMKGDSGMTKAVNESLTLTKNSVATARLGAEQFSDLATEFRDKVAFAQENKGGLDEIESDLTRLVADMAAIMSQSTFNGDDLVNAGKKGAAGANAVAGTMDAYGAVTAGATPSAAQADRSIITGISRDTAGALQTTTITVSPVDLNAQLETFTLIADSFASRAGATTDVNASGGIDGDEYLGNVLALADTATQATVDAATSLGQSEKSIERQQEFLTKLSDNLDSGVGAMVDANMEEEAARLQALQVQQQLASQSLSIANQAPQNILSLFR
ncbi:Flagellin [Sulfitobacter indolifex]|uniref:Flagellin n=1 Tax=Sulfitobacter indolifex HEL-45 TaxID=391624 RepID=A0ABM9X8D7_9RHOB|nr:flagellin [Sulfitobacter indolifex]EDQ05565.1 flagella associated protein [Sulfitobacter indolifex HEL-45]UOA19741.1 Flagellin [Sulfitobacter indolifex]